MPEPVVVPKADPAARASAVRVPVPRDDLIHALTVAVLAVPGVLRLEPTLSTGGPAVLLRRSPSDGLRLLLRAVTAEVDINIATSAACQARAVAHDVQAAIAGVLAGHGYLAGPVSVSVLTISLH